MVVSHHFQVSRWLDGIRVWGEMVVIYLWCVCTDDGLYLTNVFFTEVTGFMGVVLDLNHIEMCINMFDLPKYMKA